MDNLQRLEYLIADACAKPANRFGPDFLTQHILVNRAFGLQLATLLGADRETVEVAALLHDLAAVQDFACLPQHPQKGAALAGTILRDLGYAPERIHLICRCIETHSAPLGIGADSLEAICISNADAMAQLAKPAYWLYYTFSVRQMGYKEGKTWYRARLEAHRSALIPQAKTLIAKEITRLEHLLQEN